MKRLLLILCLFAGTAQSQSTSPYRFWTGRVWINDGGLSTDSLFDRNGVLVAVLNNGARIRAAISDSAGNLPPFRFTAGNKLTATPQTLALEPHGDSLYFVGESGTRYALSHAIPDTGLTSNASGWRDSTGIGILTDIPGKKVMLRVSAGNTDGTKLFTNHGTSDFRNTVEFGAGLTVRDTVIFVSATREFTNTIWHGVAITGTYIQNATITAADIATATITGTNIAAGTITGVNIATGTITGGLVGSGQITGGNIASGTITAGNITSQTITAGLIGNLEITAAQIANLTINGTKITSETLDSTKLKDGSISGPDIAAHTVTASNIAALTITANEIAATTITGGKIAANTITAGNIVAGTITTTEIAANTIVAADIAAGTITTTQIAAGTITASNMNVSTLSVISANLGTVTAGSISGVTITGSTLTTATSGLARIVLTSSEIGAYSTAGLEGYIYGNSSSGLTIGGYGHGLSIATGQGGAISVAAEGILWLSGSSVRINGSVALTTETDPYVSQWAREGTKPNYTYSEVGAAAASHNQDASTINSGTLPYSRGGTSNTSYSDGQLLYWTAGGGAIASSGYTASSFATSGQITWGAKTGTPYGYISSDGTWDGAILVYTRTLNGITVLTTN